MKTISLLTKDILNRFPKTFWWVAVITIGLCAFGLMQPELFTTQTKALNRVINNSFAGFYLWMVLISFLLFLSIGLSPMGKIRLGGPDAKPEFSFFSWFSMLFAAGMGVGLMFWGAAEPLYHFLNPPLATSTTVAAQEIDAFRFSFFHWGLHPWSIYGLTALAIAFFGYNRDKGFYFSSFLLPNDHQAHPMLRKQKFALDLITILAILFGVTATFSMGILHLEGGLKALYGISGGWVVQIGLIVLLSLAYTASAVCGVARGIKWISNISIAISFILLGFILFHISPVEVFHTAGQALFEYGRDFWPMSLGQGQFVSSDWVREWPVKYWSWWIAWAPFVGIFIALISKGRTIRELMLTILIAPTFFCWLWFAVWGKLGIALQLSHNLIPGGQLDFANVNRVVFDLLGIITDSPIIAFLTMLMIALFFINSADSAIYTISRIASKNPDQHPSKVVEICWGMLLMALTMLFLSTGGIALLQEVTLITTLPFSLILVVIFGKLIYDLVLYYREHYMGESTSVQAYQTE